MAISSPTGLFHESPRLPSDARSVSIRIPENVELDRQNEVMERGMSCEETARRSGGVSRRMRVENINWKVGVCQFGMDLPVLNQHESTLSCPPMYYSKNSR